jgi:hypothetical protein
LQHIEAARCQLVSDENRRALRALSAGCPGWQHIEGAKGQLGSIDAALGAMSAGCPGLHIKEALCQLVSDEGLRASGSKGKVVSIGGPPCIPFTPSVSGRSCRRRGLGA